MLILGADIDNISNTPESYVVAPDEFGFFIVARKANQRVSAAIRRHTSASDNVVRQNWRAHISFIVLNAVTNEMLGPQVRAHYEPTHKPDPRPLASSSSRLHRHDGALSRQNTPRPTIEELGTAGHCTKA